MPLESARPSYPGMFAPEQEVWRAWLLQNQRYYDSYEYNVRVGPGDDPGPAWPANLRKMAIMNSQPRIDVVAKSVRGVEIIEVKVRAQSEVVGQIKTYLHLYPSTFDYRGPLVARVVCNEIPAYVSEVLTKENIEVSVEGIVLSAPTGLF